jgi:hypothetical protein
VLDKDEYVWVLCGVCVCVWFACFVIGVWCVSVLSGVCVVFECGLCVCVCVQ